MGSVRNLYRLLNGKRMSRCKLSDLGGTWCLTWSNEFWIVRVAQYSVHWMRTSY